MDTILTALHTDASYLVASFLVLFYAASRFNTPHTVRSQTCRFQYFSSCLVYMASNQGLLMAVTYLLGQKPEWLAVLHFGSGDALPDNLNGVDAPLVAALMLTTLLPSFPFLRELDARMLRVFHKMGEIPIGAVRWDKRMHEASFVIGGKLLADTRAFIENCPQLSDALKGELQADASTNLTRFRFTRSLALYVALSDLDAWEEFGDEFPDDVAAFEKKMSSFFRQSGGFFAFAAQLSKEQLDQLHDPIEKFREAALETYDDIRLMLARVVLYSSNSDVEVARKLDAMGFAIERPAPIRIPLNLLCLDILGVILLFTTSTILFADERMELGKAVAIGLFVALNHSLAAAFALLPKQLWSFADIRAAGERPILAYVISGACALTVALPVSYGFFLLRQHVNIDSGPIMPFAGQCKWLLMSTVLSVALAFACDDFAASDHEPAELRWIESAGLAALMALTGWVVVNWMAPDQAALHPDGAAPSLTVAIVLSASIGALFGFTIPHWYRGTVRRVKAAATSLLPPSVTPAPELAAGAS
jgi:hypothetical protein